ncbi:hypothetical protein [Anaerovibrio sp. RM50]|uniref:hypothetical protein n=1 Tax=Anaerovibrio sp. RM50 TaxID=1200557 RepID=UPI000481C536|nr:hypothetical protein [Anaerovibrio sp. RM50]
MIDLDEGIKLWQQMPRNNSEELTKADDYFDFELMPSSIELFSKRYSCNERYDGMIFTVGTSWQPMALCISALKPQRICFICTEQTGNQIARLEKFIDLAAFDYGVEIIDKSSAEDIYHIANKTFESWGVDNHKFAVDITGGTKAMASALAMYAAVNGHDVFYVESTYLPLYRRPLPGSEKLVKLSMPSLQKLK